MKVVGSPAVPPVSNGIRFPGGAASLVGDCRGGTPGGMASRMVDATIPSAEALEIGSLLAYAEQGIASRARHAGRAAPDPAEARLGAQRLGVRLIALDRPGVGDSTPHRAGRRGGGLQVAPLAERRGLPAALRHVSAATNHRYLDALAVGENSDRKSPSASEVAFDPQRDDGGCEAIVLRHEQAEFDHPAVVEMCRQRSPGGVVEVLGLDEGIDSRQ